MHPLPLSVDLMLKARKFLFSHTISAAAKNINYYFIEGVLRLYSSVLKLKGMFQGFHLLSLHLVPMTSSKLGTELLGL